MEGVAEGVIVLMEVSVQVLVTVLTVTFHTGTGGQVKFVGGAEYAELGVTVPPPYDVIMAAGEHVRLPEQVADWVTVKVPPL